MCALPLLAAVSVQAQVTATVVATPGGSSITGTSPEAAYADVYGNLFVITGATSSSVVEIPANGGPEITIATGLSTARGVAADSLGNVYVSQIGATSILKYPAGGGSPTNIGTIEGRAFLMTLDTASPANLYVTDQDGARIEKINTSTGAQTLPAISGLNAPKGVALDGAGNLYVTNFNGNSVTELTTGGTVNQLALQSLNGPYGLVFDAAGDLFVMNSGDGEILKYGAGFTTSTTPTVVLTGVTTAGESVVLNSRGDLIFTNSSHVYSLQGSGANFYGTALAGTAAATATAITYTFPGATTLASTPVVYLSSNAVTAQFATSTASGDTTTCTANKAIAANGSCVVYAAMVPTQVGSINGAISLMSSAGSVLMTTPLTGVGIAPAAGLAPGTQSTFLGTGLSQPTGVGVDAGGTVYVTDVGNTTVKKDAAGTVTTLGFTGLSRPYGVAVDGMGSVYVSDNYTYAVYKMTTAGVQSTVSTSGLHSPKGIAVDGLGNLYIADSANSRVVKVTAAGTQNVLGFSGLSAPSWVAVDFAGDVFVTDSGHVYELNAAGIQSTLTTAGLGTPAGLAVGANGTLYIADSGSNDDVYVLSPSGSSFTLASGLSGASGVALASNGSVYVASTMASQVVLLNRSQDTMTFPTTAVGVASSPITSTVQNIGNSALTYSNFAVANISGQGFAQKVPVNDATDCYPAAVLAPGASCNATVIFTPTSTGTITGSATSTDNALDANGSTQTISLAGTGGSSSIGTTTAVAQTVPASGNPIYGQTFTVKATVAPVSGSGTPTGSVTFSVDGSAYGSPVTLSSGVASVSPTGITAGTHSIGAAYSGDSSYSASTGSLVITMAKATPVVTWSPVSTTELVDVALGAGTLDATVASPAGSIGYTATPAGGSAAGVVATTVLGAATYTLTATFTPADTSDYNLAYASVTPFLVGCHDGTASGVVSCNPTFTDNFNNGYLNPSVWTNSYTSYSTWETDLPTWTPDNFDFIAGGGLSIRTDARKTYFPDGLVGAPVPNEPTEPHEGDPRCESNSAYYKCFTAGAITTANSFAQAYGYFEISAQLYPGPGMFPAFWMWPANVGSLPSAPSTKTNGISEIDIFEGETTYMDNAWYGPEGSQGHVELGGYSYDVQSGGAWPLFNPTTGYHTYGLAWEPVSSTASLLTFYVDGSEINSYNTSSQTLPQYAFPMYLLIDADLGGPGGNKTNPNSGTSFPQFMNIAYVHAYQYNPVPQSGTLIPITFAKPMINNATANPTSPTVYSTTVNAGDVLNISSTIYNNTATETYSGPSSRPGPEITLGITNYFNTIYTSPAEPSPINLSSAVGPGGSAGFTFSYTVPSLSPGVYDVQIASDLVSSPDPISWSTITSGDPAARFTLVTEPRQSLTGYGYVSGEPQSGSYTINGDSINMNGNMWVAGGLTNSYTSTYYTMLEFDFGATGNADEYAIGVFPSSTYSQTNLFQLGGGSSLAGNQQYNHYVNADGTVHYTIPVGKYLTAGSVLTNLVFLATSSAGSANGTFANVRVYDLPQTTANPLGVNALTMPCFTEGQCAP